MWTRDLNPVQPVSCDKKNGRRNCAVWTDLQDVLIIFINSLQYKNDNIANFVLALPLFVRINLIWHGLWQSEFNKID